MRKPRDRDRSEGNGTPVISIVGAGMEVVGDMTAEGTIRIEGTVRGTVYAGKAVVIGKDGIVEGEVTTQDAIVSGRVQGVLLAASRLEVQATATIDGDVRTRRLQLEEGATLNGSIDMGEFEFPDHNARLSLRNNREVGVDAGLPESASGIRHPDPAPALA
jgi:cytoskeletal protein CcmA (bactofilin family)